MKRRFTKNKKEWPPIHFKIKYGPKQMALKVDLVFSPASRSHTSKPKDLLDQKEAQDLPKTEQKVKRDSPDTSFLFMIFGV